jgi:tetratricopeptide (TPR) repeat protein
LSNPSLWRSRPVFITSTFRDMNAERDWLNKHVFPELRERLRQRFHHLETIDLRWGVESASESGEQAREMLVLKVCLNEIVRSRPFLIGLLGDRYGWQPPAERMRAAAKEAGFVKDVAGKSVTELEILFGVLDSPEQRRRSWFYLREPLPYDEMPRELAARYSERHNFDKDAAAKASLLDELKRRIEKELPGRTHRYRADWDAEKRIVTGLQAWGNQVRDDLWGDLEAETEAFLRAAPTTWQGQDRWALGEVLEDRARGFVGRETITKELVELAISPASDEGEWGACVTGAAGAGKSGLFAHLYQELERPEVLLLAHAAGISVQSTGVDRMLRRWVGELASSVDNDDPLDDASKPEDIEREFARLLGLASARRRVVVVIDALNQFEASTRGLHLTWLPKLWPTNARLIATAIPGAPSEALCARPRVRERPLPAIDEREAAEIVRGICQGYHRELNPRVVGALLARRRDDGKLAHGSPLWLELAVEELNLLDADDFERADVEFAEVPPGAERMVRMLLRSVAALPADVAGAYGALFDRAKKLFGEPWSRAFLESVALSRGGWRESDLRILMPRLSGRAWDDLAFAALRRILRAHVAQRGSHAQWDFTHAHMREAVEQRMERGGADPRAAHKVIADHLLGLSREDPLHESETLVHLMGSGDLRRAAEFYGGDLTPGELDGATAALTAHIVLHSSCSDGAAQHARLQEVTALLSQSVPVSVVGRLAERLVFFLHESLTNFTPLSLREILLQSAQRSLHNLSQRDPMNLAWRRALSGTHVKIGDAQKAQADHGGALVSYRAALAITEHLAHEDPKNTDWQRDLSVSHERIGTVQAALGDLSAVQVSYRAALAITERLAHQDPKNADWQRDLSISHEGMGNAQMAQGNLGGALASFRAARAIRERQSEQGATNAAWQRDIAVVLERIGNVQIAQGDMSDAQVSHGKALAIFELLAHRDPTNAASQRDLALSHIRVGELQMAQGDLSGARASYSAGLAITERLVQQDPNNADWQRYLLAIHFVLGDAHMTERDLNRAAVLYRAALAIAKRFAQQYPNNLDWQRDLSVSHMKLGDVQTAQRDLVGATFAYTAALVIQEPLAQRDQDNWVWQRDLSLIHSRLGDLQAGSGNLGGAAVSYRKAVAIRERLAQRDRTNTTCQRDLSVSHNRLGDVQAARGALRDALASYRLALEIAESLSQQNPKNATWQRDLVVSLHKLASLAEQAPPESGDYWRRCRDALRNMKAKAMFMDPPLVQLLKQLESGLGT